MPVRIVRAHDGSGYYVEDIESRKRHSHEPMTHENAVKQARLLNSLHAHEHPHHHSRSHPHHHTIHHHAHHGEAQHAHKWIAEMHMKKGAFTEQAKRHHETVPEFEREVLEAPEHYAKKTVKRARLAETLSHLGKK